MTYTPVIGRLDRASRDRDIDELLARMADLERTRVVVYQYPNIGDWLYIETTSAGGPNAAGLEILSEEKALLTVNNDLTFDIEGVWTSEAGQAMDLSSDGDATFYAQTDEMGLGLFDDARGLELFSGGRALSILGGTTGAVEIRSGVTITLMDSDGNPLLQVTAGSPDVHIPIGGTVVADL